ncbi:ABC transporter ATP-binding protein [Pedobacter sp. AW31-3R]|uniref:ABC transporter ATP-binding protein n=1 Tax=Pedobacter sp. AW31-3R TaxID=3445781 RepID=UPI003FA005B4
MQNQILKIEHLSHQYNSSWAIQDINLEVRQNAIVGLLGSNGAGKSTTMNIMCGVLSHTEGLVQIDGIDMRKNPEEAKKRIGFLPQNPPLYLDFTVDEYLNYCASLRLIPRQLITAAVSEAKERCGVTHFSSRLLKNLSGGYRQRVGIAQAIIHKPKLVVLDEPTNGLDPNQIVEVRSLIRDIAVDRAVILSSHVLSEVQLLCNEITMIENGKVVFADTMDAFNNYVEPHSLLMLMDNPPPTEEFMKIPGVSGVDFLSTRQIRLYFNGDQQISGKIIELSALKNWQLKEISLDKSAVDEIFAQLSNKSKR